MTTRFLVADDSSVVRKVARRICEDLAFEVAEAENGEEALAMCRRSMPDAVLADWQMPLMDGYEFVRALRGLDGGSHPTIIMCLTELSIGSVTRAKRAGADGHMLKPFDRDVLESKFREVGLL